MHFHLSHRDKGQAVYVQETKQQPDTTLVWTSSYLMVGDIYEQDEEIQAVKNKKLCDQPDSRDANE